MDENNVTDTTQVPAGSEPPAQNDSPVAADVTVDAAPEPAVGSEAPANGDTPATPPESDAAPQPARKPKGDRIQELIAERNFWRERAVGGNPAQPAAPSEPAEPEGPPTLEQHGYDTEKWAQAFAQYSERHAAKVVEQHLAKVAEQNERQTVIQSFETRQASFAESTPDYIEAVSDPTLQHFVTPTMSEVIVESEIGPQMSYYLATHRDELAAIARMRPLQQSRALGRLEAKLAQAPAAAPPAAAPKPKPVQQTRAPAPPSPIGNGSAPSKRVEDMNPQEYREHRARWANK